MPFDPKGIISIQFKVGPEEGHVTSTKADVVGNIVTIGSELDN